jgi:hypothetical protein
MLFLEVGKVGIGQTTILNVPAEGRKLHDHDHLGSSDVKYAWIVDCLAVDVIDRHVTHEKHEADPRHVRGVNLRGDEIGAGGTDEYSPKAAPQVKEAYQVEHGHTELFSIVLYDLWSGKLPCYEQVLLPWLLIRYPLQDRSQGI